MEVTWDWTFSLSLVSLKGQMKIVFANLIERIMKINYGMRNNKNSQLRHWNFLLSLYKCVLDKWYSTWCFLISTAWCEQLNISSSCQFLRWDTFFFSKIHSIKRLSIQLMIIRFLSSHIFHISKLNYSFHDTWALKF